MRRFRPILDTPLTTGLTAGLALAVSALTACGGSGVATRDAGPSTVPNSGATTTSAPPVIERDPLLFLSGREEVVALRTSDGSVSYRGHAGVAAPDRSAIVQVVGRQVIAVDPLSGEARWTHAIPPDRRVRVVAPGARQVALVDGNLVTPSEPRTTTDVVIADEQGARTLTIDGNVDPEAFTLDGRTLVVVEYLPAANPDHYSVRLVDLETGTVSPVPDQPGHHPDNAPRDRMQGYARTQVASPDGRFLYTYYASPEGVHEELGTFYAFVHVLDLEHGWAFCIDLAEPFGAGADGWSEPALTVTPDGSQLLVADRVTGALASVETATFEVTQAQTLDPIVAMQYRPVASASAGVLYLGLDRELLQIDTRTLRALDAAQLPSPITGLRLDSTGTIMYAVTTANISLLSPAGETLERWDLPISDGTSADPAVAIPASGAYKCAC